MKVSGQFLILLFSFFVYSNIYAVTAPVLTTGDAVSSVANTYTISATADRGDDLMLSRGFEYGTTSVSDNRVVSDIYSVYQTVLNNYSTSTSEWVRGFDLDSSGNFYLAWYEYHAGGPSINHFDKYDSSFNLLLSTTTAEYPGLMAVDTVGNVMLSKSNRNAYSNTGLIKLDTNFNIIGTSNNLPKISYGFSDNLNNIYLFNPENTNGRIQLFNNDPTLTVATSVGPCGTGVGQFGGVGRGCGTSNQSDTMDADLTNGIIYAYDLNNSRINKFTLAGVPLGSFPSPASGSLFGNLAVNNSGNVYISGNNSVLMRYDSNGDLISTIPVPTIYTMRFDKTKRYIYINNADGIIISKIDTQNPQGTGSYTLDLNTTNALCGTTYYYRPYAVNGMGTSTGETKVFTTPACVSSPVADSTTPVRPRSRSSTRLSPTQISRIFSAPQTPAPTVTGQSSYTPPTSPTPPITPAKTTSTTPVFKRDLSYGMRDTTVKTLQSYLTTQGYTVPSTGFYGPLTKTAVMKYQKDHGLPATGFFGPRTRGVVSTGY